MKTGCSSQRFVLLIAPLFFLVGCSWFGSSGNLSLDGKVIDPLSLSPADTKCLGYVKDNLEKYKNSTAVTEPITLVGVAPKAKVGEKILLDIIQFSDCKNLPDKSQPKALISEIETLKGITTQISEISDLKLDKDKEKLKEKAVSLGKSLSSEKLPSLNSSGTNTSDGLSLDQIAGLFVRYNEKKLQELVTPLAQIKTPAELKLGEQEKAIKEIQKTLGDHGNQIQELRGTASQQGFSIIALFLFLPIVGFGGYLLGRRSSTSRSLEQNKDNNPLVKRLSKVEPDRDSGDANSRSGRGGLGRSTEKKSSSPGVLDVNNQSQPSESINSGSGNSKQGDRRSNSNSDEIPTKGSRVNEQDIELPNSEQILREQTNTKISGGNKIPNQQLTYDVALDYYKSQKYDLLQPFSQGYYSAKAESMRLNREFWGNPLELIEAYDYDGLFWIVQTIEPYFLLLPNPAKKIAKTRLPGFEYFFETNFISENYRSCLVVSPAYMNWNGSQWVMTQKGALNFVY